MHLILIIAIASFTTFSGDNTLTGKWITDLDHSTIEIFNSSEGVTGKIIQSDDAANIGKIVIKNVKISGEHSYTCDIYDPKVDTYFDGTLELIDTNRLRVKATCCFGLFSETYTWIRQ